MRDAGCRPRRFGTRRGLLAVCGPSLVVMLADTDAGSLITAAQSGARWGYRMIAPQLLLIPILYVVQEMTIRLGVFTGTGHAALIRTRFGRVWALVSAATLLASVTGALITEFAGTAGVGGLFGVPRWMTVPAAAALLGGLALAAATGGPSWRGSRSAWPNWPSSPRCCSPTPAPTPSPVASPRCRSAMARTGTCWPRT